MEIEKIIKVWSSDKYRNVMLPGVGSFTCGEVASLIYDAVIKSGNDSHKGDIIRYHKNFDA